MTRNKGMRDRMNRREFVHWAGLCGLAGVAVVCLPGCGGEKAEELGSKPHDAIQAAREAADPCNDVSRLTPDELATRTTHNYTSTARDAAKLCTTCSFWIPDPQGGLCGTCTLVKGPVHPRGGCRSWAIRRG